MKSRTFSSCLWLDRVRDRVAILCVPLVAAACAGDNVTRPDPISVPPAPPPPAPSAQFGSLFVRISTGGTDLDADGYTLRITAAGELQFRQVSGTDSVMFDKVRVGDASSWLTDVAGNCWVRPARQRADQIAHNRATTIDFVVTCEPLSGVLSDASAFIGVWQAQNWEFFADPELTRSMGDVIAEGMAGTLTISGDGGAMIQWQWRETYQWWGPDRPTLIWGHAEIGATDYGFKRSDALFATADSAKTEFECDWGDCDGPLHGEYRFVLTANRFVITRVQPIRNYAFGQPHDAWLRLVLERVQ